MASLPQLSFVDLDDEDPVITEEDKRLTLAYEGLATLPKTLTDDFGTYVECLDLSHNRIRNVYFLHAFVNLKTLILDHNIITDNIVFPDMKTLCTLWLNHNSIQCIHPFVTNLQKSCPNLTFLSLMGNAAAPSYLNGGTFHEYLQYRLYVISQFPLLKHLDDQSVTRVQREKAKEAYGKTVLDLLTSIPLPHYVHNAQEKMKHFFDEILGGPNSSQKKNRVI